MYLVFGNITYGFIFGRQDLQLFPVTLVSGMAPPPLLVLGQPRVYGLYFIKSSSLCTVFFFMTYKSQQLT